MVVELSAVNRKQFDCSVSLPRELTSLDAKIQALVRTRVTRGYVKGSVTVSAAEQAGAADTLDLAHLTAQIDAVRAAAQALGSLMT